MNYENGLPFSSILATNLDELAKRISNKKAALIIIDGGVGEGKTTMLINVLDYFNKINGFPPVDISGAQLAMGGADFLKKMRVCFDNKYPCIGYDEAGDFNKRGSLSGFNSMLNRTFETFRAFKCIVVLSLPNFGVLDNQLFDNRIPRMLIHLYDRNQSYGNFDCYDIMSMEWLRYWFQKSPIKSYAWKKVHPNFYGHFKDLDSERSNELDRVSTKNKMAILRKSEIKIEGLMSYPEIATKLNHSIDWVRRAVSNLKIKPTRQIARVKYFNNDCLNLLSEHLDTVEVNDARGKNRWAKNEA
jgi:hypothetical protein